MGEGAKSEDRDRVKNIELACRFAPVTGRRTSSRPGRAGSRPASLLEQNVVARPAVENIRAWPANQDVIPIAADQVVVSLTADEDVSAITAVFRQLDRGRAQA